MRPTAPVGEIDGDVRALCRDLVDTMYASPACVGLAANQVGADRRVCCVDVTGHRRADSCHGLIVLVDPHVVIGRAPGVAREGCLSVPDLTGEVARASEVVVRGHTPDGHDRVIEANAFEARALLHEIDHLDGRTFLDRVDSLRTNVFARKRYR